MPYTRDFSEALFRRAKIITFNRTFVAGTDADPNLKEKLIAEIPGIIQLALLSYVERLLSGRNLLSLQVAMMQNRVALEADQVAQFVADNCVMQPGEETQSGVLYRAYEKWAIEAGVLRKVTRKNFSQRLVRLGAQFSKGSGGDQNDCWHRIKTDL